MRMSLLGVVLAATVTVSGCAHKPTATAENGPAPTDYQATSTRYIEGMGFLNHPESARYSNWRGPVPGSHKGLTTPAVYGWLVCVDVNDKNNFGDYTGAVTYNLLIKNDQVVETTLSADGATCLISG